MEAATYEEDGRTNGTHFQSAVPGDKPGRVDASDRSRRWNIEVLESIPAKEIITIA